MVDAAFGNWLAGFIDGEGCFDIHRRGASGNKREYYYCRFMLAVRNDDRAILDEIVAKTGLGALQERKMEKYAPTSYSRQSQTLWSVTKRDHMWKLVVLLERYPLRAKKCHDLEIWTQALRYCENRKRGSGWAPMVAYKEGLQAQRRYREASDDAELASVMSP